MLKQITQVPARFFQLALLNIGLIIALSKGLSFLHIILSLVLIILVAAPVAVYFNIIEKQNLEIVHKESQERLSKMWTNFITFWKSWNSQPEQNRLKHITIILFTIYLSITFICPCIESFLIINSIFIFVFMPEQTSLVMNLASHPIFNCCEPAK